MTEEEVNAEEGYGEEVKGEEEILEEKEDPINPPIFYYGYGAVSLWSIIVGYLILGWYPNRFKTDAWWKLQCPETAYTTASYKTLKDANGIDCKPQTEACPEIVL